MARVELNEQGIRELLQSPEVQRDLERRGRAVAERAGAGIDVEVSVGPNRARVSVSTGTTEARIAEARDRTLSSALDGARG